MQGRTVILVSHHVQLCTPGASYIAALDKGRVLFEGSKDDFYSSGIMNSLVQTTDFSGEMDDKERKVTPKKGKETFLAEEVDPPSSETSSIVPPSTAASIKAIKKPARKLVEDEKRAVGHIGRDIWGTYIRACGNVWYWLLFISIFIIASASPVLENGWLRYEIITLTTYILLNDLSGTGQMQLWKKIQLYIYHHPSQPSQASNILGKTTALRFT